MGGCGRLKLLSAPCCIAMPSGECLGVLNSKLKCKLSKKGGPISLRYRCEGCNEMRCRAHCRCAREGSLVGRARARSSARAATNVTQPKPAPPVQPPKPIGRPSVLACDVLEVREWWAQLLVELREADEVTMVSYVFDHSKLVDILVRRLGGRSPPSVVVLVDRAALKEPWRCFHRSSTDGGSRGAGPRAPQTTTQAPQNTHPKSSKPSPKPSPNHNKPSQSIHKPPPNHSRKHPPNLPNPSPNHPHGQDQGQKKHSTELVVHFLSASFFRTPGGGSGGRSVKASRRNAWRHGALRACGSCNERALWSALDEASQGLGGPTRKQ